MAKASDAASAPATARKPSLIGLLGPVLVLTIVAAAGGALVGKQIVAAATRPAAAAQKPAGPPPVTTAVRELAPIVTNLAAPEGAWIRLQAAIVYDQAESKQIDLTAGQITDDTVAFIKTLSVTDLQGASGLQHLREDLNERVALRSQGLVHEVIIESLVVQ